MSKIDSFPYQRGFFNERCLQLEKLPRRSKWQLWRILLGQSLCCCSISFADIYNFRISSASTRSLSVLSAAYEFPHPQVKGKAPTAANVNQLTLENGVRIVSREKDSGVSTFRQMLCLTYNCHILILYVILSRLYLSRLLLRVVVPLKLLLSVVLLTFWPPQLSLAPLPTLVWDSFAFWKVLVLVSLPLLIEKR